MKKFSLFLLIIFLNLIFRVYVSINSQPLGDILVHVNWAQTLNQTGLKGSYFYDKWIYGPPTQPPLMMLSFAGSNWIYQNRNIFSAMHNFIKVPPSFILLGFQKYGEILALQFWEYLATLIISFVVYFYFSKKYTFKKSFLIFLLILFNPITIFVNSVWGQNDLLPTCFMYLSFLLLFTPFNIVSPVIFVFGVLFKPTIIILAPLFSCLYLYKIWNLSLRDKIIKIILAFFSVGILVFVSFKPFIPLSIHPTEYILNIVNNRISISSKGLKIASVSAFNLYSFLFKIDQTYATNKDNFIQMADIGLVFFVILNILFIYKIIKSQKITFSHSLFSIYFITQGSFLFMTNMLDRYFMPAFISSVVISIIYWKKYGWLMVLQQVIWLVNLIYAYYYRTNEPINNLFRAYNFLVIRLISFINIFVFISLFQRYQKYLSINKQID